MVMSALEARATALPCSSCVIWLKARLALTSSSVAGAGSWMAAMAVRAAESDRPLPDSSATVLMKPAMIRLATALEVVIPESGCAARIWREASWASCSVIRWPSTTAAVSAVAQPDTASTPAVASATNEPRRTWRKAVGRTFTDFPLSSSSGRDRTLTGAGRAHRADPGGVGDAAQHDGADQVTGPLQDCRVTQRFASHPRRR